ncbi:hypothetical protein KUCAC02_031792 [Chaenocephalus aceratus]|nr:hypothetical protein KUCAC02_031792 [Chaenocephalus aceratus]
MEKTYSLTAHYDEFQEVKYGGRYSSDILSNGMTLSLGGSLDRHTTRGRGGTLSNGRNKDLGSTSSSGGLPRWSRREICLLSALVFAAGMCVILGSMLALKYISLDAQQDPQCRQDCQRKRSLLRAARFVQSNIDPTIQPCQDFYSFACGGWLRRHGIPEDKLSYGIITAIGEHNEEKMERLLLEPIRRQGVDSAERKVKDFYRSCVNMQEIDKLGSDPMTEGVYSTAVFFSLTVNVDDKNSSRNAIRILAAYKALMERLLSMLGAHNATQKSKEIIHLETRLANITVSEYDDQRKDISTMYNRITLRQLQNIAPSLHWKRLLDRIFHDNLSEDEEIVVLATDYIQKVSDIIKSTSQRLQGAAATPSTLLPPPCSLHPAPSTLLPPACSLHPAPSTLLPPPSSLHPAPSTLLPPPCSLHPAPSTLLPPPCSLQLAPSTLLPPPCFLHPAPSTLLPPPCSSTLLPPACSLHPAPSTLLPPPSSLHPAPSTLLPPPCSLHPAPSTLLPPPCSLHPAPSSLLPPPCSLPGTLYRGLNNEHTLTLNAYRHLLIESVFVLILQVLHNYMLWRIVAALSEHLSTAFRSTIHEFSREIDGTEQQLELGRLCLTQANKHFGMALGALFVQQHFSSQSKAKVGDLVISFERYRTCSFVAMFSALTDCRMLLTSASGRRVQELVEEIKLSLDLRLQELDWMDEATKDAAREKLKHMMVMTGYPDFLLKPELIDQEYGFEVDEKTYFKNILRSIKFNIKLSVQKIREEVDKTA